MVQGRLTDYKASYAEQAKKLCLLGATNMELANFFGVAEKTIYNWLDKHEDFLQATMEGREKADAEIANSLYNRAKGFEWVEEQAIKVKRGKDQEEIVKVEVQKIAPPDYQSASLWLRNRQPKKWRDKQEHTHEVITPTLVDDIADAKQIEADSTA